MQPAGAAGKHAAEARKLQRKNGQSEPAAALYLATSRLQRPETDEAPERSAETRQRLRREVDVLRATAAAKYGDSSFQDAGRRRATCGGNPPTVLWDKVIKHDHSFQQAAQGITFHFRGAPSEVRIECSHGGWLWLSLRAGIELLIFYVLRPVLPSALLFPLFYPPPLPLISPSSLPFLTPKGRHCGRAQRICPGQRQVQP